MPDLAVDSIMQGFKLHSSPLHDAIFAFEPQRKAHVHKLKQGHMLDGISGQTLQQLEKLFTAEGFVVEAA